MGNDLIDGFQAGWKVFEPQIAHKLRMKELKKSKGLDAEESRKGRRHAIKMEDLRNQHQTERDKMGRYHDVELQDARLANAITMQKADLSTKKGIAKATRKATSIENKADRAAAMAVLKKRLKHEASEGALNRDARKAEKKLDRELGRDGYKNDAAINKLNNEVRERMGAADRKAAGERLATQTKSTERIQGTYGDRTEDQRRRDKKLARLERKRIELGAKLEDGALTLPEKIQRQMEKNEVRYGELTDTYNDVNLPPDVRKKAWRQAKGMYNAMHAQNQSAQSVMTKGDVQDHATFAQMFTDPNFGQYHAPLPQGGSGGATTPRPTPRIQGLQGLRFPKWKEAVPQHRGEGFGTVGARPVQPRTSPYGSWNPNQAAPPTNLTNQGGRRNIQNNIIAPKTNQHQQQGPQQQQQKP